MTKARETPSIHSLANIKLFYFYLVLLNIKFSTYKLNYGTIFSFYLFVRPLLVSVLLFLFFLLFA